MLFLIEYDRPTGTLMQFRKFDESERQAAQDARLKLELALNDGGFEHEVVILDAPNEEALRRTHGRYFKTLAELVGELTTTP
ncbi:MAG TPA: hypothetical protein VL523_16505 [Terriglobia bacterium]|nr:hypothetical protein [Terriglobia bacterium]